MSGFVPYELCAAGHPGSLVSESGGLFMKPSNQAEIDFYTSLQIEPSAVDLLPWVPQFYGCLTPQDSTAVENVESSQKALEASLEGTTAKSEKSQQYLVLENLTDGFRGPCVLDVKLGKKLWAEDASEEKKKRLDAVADSTTSGSLGIRVCGMKVWQSSDTWAVFDKWYGREMKSHQLMENIRDHFFQYSQADDTVKLRIKGLIERFHARLLLVKDALEKTEVRLVSSSLLFIYEADWSRWDEMKDEDVLIKKLETVDIDEESEGSQSDEEEFEAFNGDEQSSDDEEEPAPLSRLAMIDFAHSKFTPGQGKDQNVLEGLDNLVNLFAEMKDSLDSIEEKGVEQT